MKDAESIKESPKEKRREELTSKPKGEIEQLLVCTMFQHSNLMLSLKAK